MRTIRQVNIKNKQNYFFSDMTNIKDFDPSLLDVKFKQQKADLPLNCLLISTKTK